LPAGEVDDIEKTAEGCHVNVGRLLKTFFVHGVVDQRPSEDLASTCVV
jgi:hypothetical protein